ncbi:hypothetical protein EIP86_001367 [Pleurotus ostreatoroseus]|nr:hypothetical protein EIP86_001367 [Pleurotus ostreatoroseus]
MEENINSAHTSNYVSTLLADEPTQNISLVRDTLITLLFAGRESTQNTISWMMYEVTRQPEWISLLRDEAEYQAARSGTFIPSYSELQSYPLHLAVCYETLRLWPGLPKNARQAMQDDILPAIPERGLPAVWGSDAAQSNPRRHINAEGNFIKPPTPQFHSFGCGPRACPAMQLSVYEIVCIFVALLHHFDFCPTHPGIRTAIDAFAPFMDGPFVLRVKERYVYNDNASSLTVLETLARPPADGLILEQ